MKIFNENEINDFLSHTDYDIRKSHNARWIDQKCTPDVCSIIADCIVNYVTETKNDTFSSRDIWNSKYAVENIEAIFKKAAVQSGSTKSEYDKFFQQPMKMFAYVGILAENKNGRENIFTVENIELLEYIALAEKYALVFLQNYIIKVLTDSELLPIFNSFFQSQTKTNFSKMKTTFEKFIIANTPINIETECRRIFTKVINPLAFKNNSLGTEKGELSKSKITYDMLMYNRDNFRDIYSGKQKDVARKDYELLKPNADLTKYQSIRAKAFIREYNFYFRNGVTELLEKDELHIKATNMHHIFPENEFPIIAGYIENIIALTPNQHFIRVHPNNKTSAIDLHYQHQCLIAKMDRIKENIESNTIETIYDFEKFLFVICTGLTDKTYMLIPKYDYVSLKAKLAVSYAAVC